MYTRGAYNHMCLLWRHGVWARVWTGSHAGVGHAAECLSLRVGSGIPCLIASKEWRAQDSKVSEHWDIQTSVTWGPVTLLHESLVSRPCATRPDRHADPFGDMGMFDKPPEFKTKRRRERPADWGQIWEMEHSILQTFAGDVQRTCFWCFKRNQATRNRVETSWHV